MMRRQRENYKRLQYVLHSFIEKLHKYIVEFKY